MASKIKENTNIAIIGLGRFGMSLAVKLSKDKRKLVCIDKDEKKVKEVLKYCDYAFVTDDLSQENLEDLGIKNCEIAIF